MPKFWIISDTHFGIRNCSKKWESLMKGWVDNFLFPLFSSSVEDGDVLVHCGDVFDNRQSIGLSTMDMCINFFERLSGYFKDIRVLCGNHDAYLTTVNDITSIDCIKHIPGVSVIKDPVTDVVFGKTVGFVPWTENPDAFRNLSVDGNRPEILFCHAEFSGCIMNSYGTKSESTLAIPDISRIYTGHIHHTQKCGNVTYVGSAYQITQNDRGNARGVLTYCPDSGVERFYPNTFSPEFKRVAYTDISGMRFGEFKKMCGNSFIEVETDGRLMTKCRFQKLLSLVSESDNIMDLSFVPMKGSDGKNSDINISDCASISEMLDRYIDDMVVCDAQTKKSVRMISKKLIHEL